MLLAAEVPELVPETFNETIKQVFMCLNSPVLIALETDNYYH